MFFIILGGVLLHQGKANLNIYDLPTLWNMGFGTVSANSQVDYTGHGLLPTVLFANSPQAILSFLYLTYNGLYSCMLGAHEWSLFARSRRTLRVTSPAGKQRSTYYLQLPYYYAIVSPLHPFIPSPISFPLNPHFNDRTNPLQPLLILSGLLHWLMSQSLFLSSVDVFTSLGTLSSQSILSVGYSCIAIIFAIIVGCVAVTAGIANGFRLYNAGIPLVGSCSAAISAACHRPKDDRDASLEAVKWGAGDMDGDGEVDERGERRVGHCCLTSFEVSSPVPGELYAGIKRKSD